MPRRSNMTDVECDESTLRGWYGKHHITANGRLRLTSEHQGTFEGTLVSGSAKLVGAAISVAINGMSGIMHVNR